MLTHLLVALFFSRSKGSMKKVMVLMVAIVSLSVGQALPVITDVVQGGDAYTVHKSDSSKTGHASFFREGKYKTMYRGVWTENKGFLNAFFDSCEIWLNPRWSNDSTYYIPQKLYKGQSAGWLHRRIDFTRTDIDSFVEIPRQN